MYLISKFLNYNIHMNWKNKKHTKIYSESPKVSLRHGSILSHSFISYAIYTNVFHYYILFNQNEILLSDCSVLFPSIMLGYLSTSIQVLIQLPVLLMTA